MINKNQLRDMINEITAYLSIRSKAGTNLLMGTAAQESKMGTYFKQIDGGPALGIFQMEPKTEDDIWINYLHLTPHTTLKDYIIDLTSAADFSLQYNIAYQIAMARMQYYRHSEPLPDANNVEALAKYWKKYYNTYIGKGTIQEFINNYKRYVL